ncbi:MAG TPA: response regulator [Clostridiaceae bacterium]
MYKVVIVDDEPWVLLGIRNTFAWSTLGFEIIAELTNPYEALETILKEKPEVVFCDVRMPGMTGIELLEKLRAEKRETEFIIVTGFAEFQYAQKALKNGAFDYLLKPINESIGEDILKRLKFYLDEKYGIKKEINQDETDNRKFNNMLTYINEHYTEKHQLKELAIKFNLSPNYCSSIFKKYKNINFTDYITEIRMKAAAELLKDKNLSVEDVANTVGISDYYYFSKVFKKYWNTTPGNFRKTN